MSRVGRKRQVKCLTRGFRHVQTFVRRGRDDENRKDLDFHTGNRHHRRDAFVSFLRSFFVARIRLYVIGFQRPSLVVVRSQSYVLPCAILSDASVRGTAHRSEDFFKGGLTRLASSSFSLYFSYPRRYSDDEHVAS